MSKRLVFALVLMALTLFGLSACSPCDMVAPDLISPDWREVLDPSSASLNWYYSDSSCTPDNFEVILSKDNSYSVVEHSGIVSGSSSTWTPPVLDDAEEYFWRVRAVDSGDNGPWSTELRSFFTGPICSAGDLVFPPSLTYPPSGGFFDRSYDSLEWEWQINACIPESYRIEVSMDSGFVDTTYNGGTGTPGTRWGFGSTPPAATQFWWRVSAFADGVWGSPSAVHSFFTDPACPAAGLLNAVAETPIDDDILNTLTPEFTWSYPDSSCAPEGFHFQSSETSDFSTVFIDADNPTIATQSFAAGYPYNDCQEYYWRAAVVSGGVETAFTTPRRFVIDETGNCDCAPGATTIPIQTDPGNYQILPDANAMLRWNNPGGCFPDGAAVQIATDYDFADMNEFTFPGQFVTGYDPPALDPATQYRWKAAYYMDVAGSPVIGDYSGPRSFFTGPECTSLAEVVAPIRLSPTDGSVVNENFAALKHTPGTPGCIPDGYLLHLHEMADFSDPNQLTENAFPATTVLTDPLTDCTTYYWSVTAVQDGGYGPESDHGSFFVDVDGTCGPGGVPGTAKSNTFCRESTFANSEGFATHKVGDRVLAIARNPFSTYLFFTILDQETGKPYQNEIRCWSFVDHFTLKRSMDELMFVDPPPEEIFTCAEDTGPVTCKAVGGTYDEKKHICNCP